ncbi:hypothetical protein POX_a00461 [Penicillium oxalicum]|uniref:Uncharacterized protein n=1 Tax=Penicillium oxalicum (strain 114-2 / CGMCC 5302) TaxID=933388 RepID=S8A0C9_PENO1|nr:hypothetical protein POX_a00461 [Penicillium oxalicum]EPS34566.1 hypothetical protein PDE_09530 [Penicillium oxalicum 114-2]KAI2793873.1 hypothetical protein POX_a00461 [Penicillium oxalicum]
MVAVYPRGVTGHLHSPSCSSAETMDHRADPLQRCVAPFNLDLDPTWIAYIELGEGDANTR